VSMRSASGDIKVDAGNAIRVEGGSHPSFVRLRARPTRSNRWTLARDERWIATAHDAIRVHRHDRLRGSRQLRHLVAGPRIRRVWYPSRVAARLGSLSPGALGLRAPLGMDLDRGRAVGLRALSTTGDGSTCATAGAGTRARAPLVPLGARARSPSSAAPTSASAFPEVRRRALGWYPLAPWERYEPGTAPTRPT
jgi:hypothetical protein